MAIVMLGCPDAEDPSDSPDPPEFPHHYTTEHLRVHSELEFCAGDLARWEGFIEYTESYLGVETPEIIDLYIWSVEEFDAPKWCNLEIWTGCFRRPGLIYSSLPAVEHELVHAVTSDLANRDMFFREGLAVAISDQTAFGLYPPVFPRSRSTEVDYPSAGHFVRWLLESAGPDVFVEYMSIEGAGAEEFQSRYPGDFTSAFYAEAEPTYPRMFEYPAPELTHDGDITWSSELVFDCALADVRATPAGLVVLRQMDLPQSGFYAVWMSTGSAVSIRKQFAAPPYSVTFPGPGIGGGVFEAGRYEISIAAPKDGAPGVLHVWLDQNVVPTWPTEQP